MATTTIPVSRGINRNRWLIGGAIIIIIALIAGLALGAPSAPPAASGPTTVTVSRGDLVATISGSGTIAAAQTLDLPFRQSGSVAEVLVEEGDRVTAGQPLARLDDRDLQLQVASAQASLDSARARLSQTREGNATDEDINAAEASLASAEAQLRSARAQLDALRNPSTDTISTAEYSVRQAEIDLQAQRDNSSASKTRAEQDLQKAVASLTQAQSRYSTAMQNWEYVRSTGNDPQNPTTTSADGRTQDNELNDAQRQQYYDEFIQAEAGLRSAEQAVAQAQVSYDNARQQEVANIQQAEAALANAQAQLAALNSPSRADMTQRQASIDQAQASVDQARANLAKLTAAGTTTDISIQEAAVAQAEQSLAQAQLALEQATLVAPFDGIVTLVNIVPGSVVGTGGAAVSLVNDNPLHIDLKLSENDVATVALDQPVTLSIDALDGWTETGVVSYIAPSAEDSNGVVTYRVRVTFANADPRVRIGMTATIAIETARAQNVLLVPVSALLPKGAGRVVQIPADEGVREVDVTTGLSDGVQTEIVSGLNEGDAIIATPGTNNQPQPGGLFGR